MRFGTQIQQDDDAIAVQTLYYSHNTNRAFPDPMVPDPGSRIRINETPYTAGTTMSFAPDTGNSNNLIATIRGPSAQRVADDLNRTFTSAQTSRIGALWFADHGDAFSEVNTRVGIDFTDVTRGHFLEASRIRNWTAPQLVPGAAAERMTSMTDGVYSANTMISWVRDGANFVVTITGADRERLGRSLRNFLSVRSANRSTLYFRSDNSTDLPANDAAARALPYIALNVPPIPEYSGGAGRMVAVENQRPTVPTDLMYDQSGATLLSLYGLEQLDTEVIRFPDGKTITARYPEGATNIDIPGISVYSTNAAFIAARDSLVDGSEFIIRSTTETFTARSGVASILPNTNAELGENSSYNSSCIRNW